MPIIVLAVTAASGISTAPAAILEIPGYQGICPFGLGVEARDGVPKRQRLIRIKVKSFGNYGGPQGKGRCSIYMDYVRHGATTIRQNKLLLMTPHFPPRRESQNLYPIQHSRTLLGFNPSRR